jgi:hypothetical protein
MSNFTLDESTQSALLVSIVALQAWLILISVCLSWGLVDTYNYVVSIHKRVHEKRVHVKKQFKIDPLDPLDPLDPRGAPVPVLLAIQDLSCKV